MRHLQRRAFSLVEVIFAFAMLASLVGVLMHFFLSSQKQAMGSEQKLNSATLAQMVVERVRSHIAVDPAWFRELGMSGGVWTSSGPVIAAPGQPVSPFFADLFQRDANRALLTEAYRDYTVDVRIEDDVPLDTAPTAGTLREMVKKLTVTVNKGSVGAVASLTSRFVTPPESLSPAAIAALHDNFDNPTLVAASQEEFFQAAGDAPYLSEDYLGKRRSLIADCYMVLSTVNTEAYFVQKQSVASGFMLDERKPAKSLNEWLAELSQPNLYQYAAFKKQVARVSRMKAMATFDAFRRVLPLLEDLNTGHQQMVPEVDEMTAILVQTQEKIVDLNKDTLDSMKAYQENVKKKQDAEKALSDLDKKQEEVDRLVADVATLLTAYETAKTKVDELEAQVTPPPQSEIDDARAKRDDAKRAWEDKKREAEEKQADVTAKKTDQLAKKTAAETTMNGSLATINARMQAFAALTTASGKDLMERLQLVVVCKFMNDFFQNASYQPIVNRIRAYPAQFRSALDTGRNALRDLIRPEGGATPLEATLAVQDLVEIEKTRMLDGGADDASIRTELDALLAAQGPRLKEAAQYAKASELASWSTLSTRNRRFLERLAVLKNMGDPANPANTFENIVKLYAPGGKIKVFLDTYTKVTSEIALSSDSTLVQLNREIQGLRGDLSLIGNATQEEILRAMAGTK